MGSDSTGSFFTDDDSLSDLEGGGGDHLSIGVTTPTEVLHPIPVAGYLFSEPVTSQPQVLELSTCAEEGQRCEFRNLAAVRYTLGWAAIPPAYTVEKNGVLCKPFGGSQGGMQYVKVAERLNCGGSSAAKVTVGGPNWPTSNSTDGESKQACKRACSRGTSRRAAEQPTCETHTPATMHLAVSEGLKHVMYEDLPIAAR